LLAVSLCNLGRKLTRLELWGHGIITPLCGFREETKITKDSVEERDDIQNKDRRSCKIEDHARGQWDENLRLEDFLGQEGKQAGYGGKGG